MSIQTITRNANLADMVELLRDRQARKSDVVTPAASLRSQNGALVVAGAGEPTITPDGVSAAAARLRPTEVADRQIADKLGIPTAYLRRLRAEHVELFDANVNGWLDRAGSKRFLVRGLVDGRSVDGHREEPRSDGTHGVMRSLLSDSYRVIEDLDVVMASLAGITSAGVPAEVTSCDLTDQRMYVAVSSPAVSAVAPSLLARYVSPFTGNRGADNPIVFAGFVISNSETGCGRYTLTPRITIEVCRNGMTISKDALGEVHLGGKLDAGPVRWSEDTTRKATDLISAKTADAVAAFLDVDYVRARIAEIEAEAGTPISDVTATVAHVATDLRYTKSQSDAILADFIDGADRTAGGMLHAVTSAAQRQDDADTAHAMEADGLTAMSLAARFRP